MKKASLFCALVIAGTLGLSGSTAAKDRDKDFRHHEAREARAHHDDHARHEAWEREHQARERRERERREREHREWARNHHEHHDNGRHLGWDKGRHNPHRNTALTESSATPSHHPPRPVRQPIHNEPPTQGK